MPAPLTAVVTGSSSGIGAAVAARLGRTMRVVGLARRGDVAVDLTEPAARAATFARLAAELDEVSVLVNNAGATTWAATTEVPLDEWRALMELNFWAPIELIRALLPRMPRGAQLINVSSVTTRHLPGPRFTPYAVTKGALAGALHGLRLELAEKGIRVTDLAPGLVDTPLYQTVAGFSRVEGKLREAVPHWLSPEDVADAVEWIVARPPHVEVAEMVVLPTGQGR